MFHRVDNHAINFHFEQRTRSILDLSAAMHILAEMNGTSVSTANLIREIARQLCREASSDQMLLALWRLAMLTSPGEDWVDLPEELGLIITTAFEPRCGGH